MQIKLSEILPKVDQKLIPTVKGIWEPSFIPSSPEIPQIPEIADYYPFVNSDTNSMLQGQEVQAVISDGGYTVTVQDGGFCVSQERSIFQNGTSVGVVLKTSTEGGEFVVSFAQEASLNNMVQSEHSLSMQIQASSEPNETQITIGDLINQLLYGGSDLSTSYIEEVSLNKEILFLLETDLSGVQTIKVYLEDNPQVPAIQHTVSNSISSLKFLGVTNLTTIPTNVQILKEHTQNFPEFTPFVKEVTQEYVPGIPGIENQYDWGNKPKYYENNTFTLSLSSGAAYCEEAKAILKNNDIILFEEDSIKVLNRDVRIEEFGLEPDVQTGHINMYGAMRVALDGNIDSQAYFNKLPKFYTNQNLTEIPKLNEISEDTFITKGHLDEIKMFQPSEIKDELFDKVIPKSILKQDFSEEPEDLEYNNFGEILFVPETFALERGALTSNGFFSISESNFNQQRSVSVEKVYDRFWGTETIKQSYATPNQQLFTLTDSNLFFQDEIINFNAVGIDLFVPMYSPQNPLPLEVNKLFLLSKQNKECYILSLNDINNPDVSVINFPQQWLSNGDVIDEVDYIQGLAALQMNESGISSNILLYNGSGQSNEAIISSDGVEWINVNKEGFLSFGLMGLGLIKQQFSSTFDVMQGRTEVIALNNSKSFISTDGGYSFFERGTSIKPLTDDYDKSSAVIGGGESKLQSSFVGIYFIKDGNRGEVYYSQNGTNFLAINPENSSYERNQFIGLSLSFVYKRDDGSTGFCRIVESPYNATEMVTVPQSSTDEGTKGQIQADANYLYICYDDNSWIKVPKEDDPNW